MFHDFRRTTAAGVHVLSIQFEKYQRARCVLNVWVEPPEGLDAVIPRARLKFIAWLLLVLGAIPLIFRGSMLLVRGIFSLVMMATGNFNIE